MRVGSGAMRSFWGISRVPFHAFVLVLGTALLLTNAFHGNVWFDESYSVGIASHSFADIWDIGSNDVHPVLFYWCLHVLYLLFGQNVLAYRLFAVAGVVALAALGLTCLRRDFGWRVGLAFSFLILFMPYLAIEGTQIRMYSWAAFAVMLCFVYAWRIFSVLRVHDDAGLRREDARGGAAVPKRWWAAFFLSSLASAYLHYFAVIAAFVINLLLFCYLLVRARSCGRQLGVFLAGAFGQVLLYAPWLVELARQMSVVGGTYWAVYTFPLSLIELFTYPFLPAPLSFALRGAYGEVPQGFARALCIALLAIAAALVLYLVVRAVRAAVAGGAAARGKAAGGAAARGKAAGGAACRGAVFRLLPSWLCRGYVVACLAGLAVYAGVYAIGWAASALMDSYILYYRYLSVALGPLVLAAALLLSRVDSRALVTLTCAVAVGLSVLNQVLLVQDSYAGENEAPLACFQEMVGEAEDENAADGELGDTLVLSSDIGVQGVLAVTFPDVGETYLDWQPGNWGAAYEAYAPSLTSVKSWSEALAEYEGAFVAVGQTQDGSVPKCIADIEQGCGAEVVEQRTFYRPYERTWFTIALMRV